MPSDNGQVIKSLPLKKFSHKELILICCIIALLGTALLFLIIILQAEFSPKTQSPNNSTLFSAIQKNSQPFSAIKNNPQQQDRTIRTIAHNDQSFFVGPVNAQVTVVEFLDFQCPFCKQMVPVFHQLMHEYEGKPVKFEFRHFPIVTKHPFAFNSALAAECARDQQAFIPFHDLLYEKQTGFSNTSLITSAQELNLTLSLFNTCLSERTYQTRILKDLSDGFDLGITGTPAIYINNQTIIGATPYEELKKLIDQELQKTSPY